MSPPTGTVLITGCSSGIGQALARQCHHSGLMVCATARRVDTLASLAAEGIQTLPLDVCDAQQIARTLDTLHAQGQHVGMLINNAGYGAMGPLVDVALDTWRAQFDVNLFAPVAMVQAVLPDMLARRQGRIVNVSSISGVAPTPFASPYCASKAALNAVSDSLRMELRPLGIDVVTLQPGGIRSTFGESAGAQLSLRPDSPFMPVADGIRARTQAGQQNAMPAERFAQLAVAALMRPDCPPVLRFGEHSRLLPALKRWLPTRALDAVLSRRFQLGRLQQR